MTTEDLNRLSALCRIVDHLERHGRLVEAEPFKLERDRVMARCLNPDKKGKR